MAKSPSLALQKEVRDSVSKTVESDKERHSVLTSGLHIPVYTREHEHMQYLPHTECGFDASFFTLLLLLLLLLVGYEGCVSGNHGNLFWTLPTTSGFQPS